MTRFVERVERISLNRAPVVTAESNFAVGPGNAFPKNQSPAGRTRSQPGVPPGGSPASDPTHPVRLRRQPELSEGHLICCSRRSTGHVLVDGAAACRAARGASVRMRSAAAWSKRSMVGRLLDWWIGGLVDWGGEFDSHRTVVRDGVGGGDDAVAVHRRRQRLAGEEIIDAQRCG